MYTHTESIRHPSYFQCSCIEHTHPFNGPLSGTTQVSQYQKGKTNLDFTEAGDSEWQWHQLGHMQVFISLLTDNHASTPLLSFLQAGCPSCHPTKSVKALKSLHTYQKLIDSEKSAKYWEGVNFPSLLGISGLVWSELQGGALSPTRGSAAGPLRGLCLQTRYLLMLCACHVSPF